MEHHSTHRHHQTARLPCHLQSPRSTSPTYAFHQQPSHHHSSSPTHIVPPLTTQQQLSTTTSDTVLIVVSYHHQSTSIFSHLHKQPSFHHLASSFNIVITIRMTTIPNIAVHHQSTSSSLLRSRPPPSSSNQSSPSSVFQITDHHLESRPHPSSPFNQPWIQLPLRNQHHHLHQETSQSPPSIIFNINPAPSLITTTNQSPRLNSTIYISLSFPQLHHSSVQSQRRSISASLMFVISIRHHAHNHINLSIIQLSHQESSRPSD